MNRDNSNFIDFLSFDIGSQIFRENMLSIHIETGSIFYDNYNTGESICFFAETAKRYKKTIHATLTYTDSFSNYMKYFIDIIDTEEFE